MPRAPMEPEAWHALEGEAVPSRFGVDTAHGRGQADVITRGQTYGPTVVSA